MPWGRMWQDASHGSRSTAREPGGHERMAMRNYMPAHWQLCACAGIHRHVCANAHQPHSMCNCIPELVCASCRRVPAQIPRGHAVLACGRERMLLGDSHMMLFLSFRRVAGSSLGVCGVPRAVEALVESLSKASMSGDWGELSMRLATSALWYCCRVTWAHGHVHPAQWAPSPTRTSRRLGGSNQTSRQQE